jgi:hypothetical protein
MGGIPLERATTGAIVSERTAAAVWSVLSRIRQPVVLWNIFPLHPHEWEDPFSNRCHTRAERVTVWPLLVALIKLVKPRRIIAIGRDAGISLADIEIPVQVVRHPSYGGQAEFIAGLHSIYGVRRNRLATMG